MPDINITGLTNYADPKSTDVLPVVDVTADVTKKVTVDKILKNATPGTAADPGITFDGRATNTGIYSPSDYQIGIATNGVSRVFCRENGNVGINNSNPAFPLDVNGNTSITGTLAVSGAVTLTGDLTVNGTTTTINSTTLTVDDKNIELGSVATPTNTTADGGGITLKGTTDKTFNWVNSTTCWTSSESLNLALGKTYKINGTDVLSATLLGSAVQIAASNIPTGTIVDAAISATAEIAVSKLADGAARQLLQTDAAGTGVEWASNIDIPGTLDVTGAAIFDSSVTVTGDLIVNGTTTTVNSTTVTVDDKNIELGSIASPTDALADGGGITLKGTTDKSLNWVSATSAWTSSEHLNLVTGKSYYINGTSVLSSTALGTGVSVGASQLTGTIPTGVLGNSSLFVGTTSVALNRASANLALTGISSIALPGATSGTVTVTPSATAGTTAITIPGTSGTLITTGDTGTVSSTMLANSLSLVTPLLGTPTSGNLSNCTNVPAAQLSGTIPSGVLGNSTTYVGTTAIPLNRASGNQSLTGILSVALAGATSGTVTITPVAAAGTTAITVPATSGTLVTTGDTGSVTSTMIADGTIVNGDINASAAIAGTKIAPDFGSQNTTTTGTATAASFIPSSSTAPTNGLYLAAANTPALSAGSTEYFRVTSTGVIVTSQPAPAVVDASATLTVADLTSGIITSTTAAAVTMTLPTGTLMDGGFSPLYTNLSFDWSVINTGATNAVTVQGGTGHTIVGSGTVAASNSGLFRSCRTGATTWVTYRVSS